MDQEQSVLPNATCDSRTPKIITIYKSSRPARISWQWHASLSNLAAECFQDVGSAVTVCGSHRTSSSRDRPSIRTQRELFV